MKVKNLAKTCWVITDGSAGMENQAWGLGEALGCQVTLKRIVLRNPWLFFAPYFRLWKKFCLGPSSDKIEAPWPDLIVACGRRPILPALFVKEESKNKTKVVYLQDPKISPKYFDAVVCPKHDKLQGPNIIEMVGASHRITKEYLQEGYEAFAPIFSKYPGPRYSILIGGPNRVFQLTPKIAHLIVEQLKHLQQKNNASLLISPSRRTPLEVINIFKQAFSDNPRIYFWDQQGKNPYFALLSWADAIILTCDSVSMASEACSTSKPVYLIPLPGGSSKFASFHEQLLQIKRIRWFEGKVDLFKCKSFDETLIVAEKLKALLHFF